MKLAEGNRAADERRFRKAQRLLKQIIDQVREADRAERVRLYEINRRIPPPPGVDPYSQ